MEIHYLLNLAYEWWLRWFSLFFTKWQSNLR